MEELRTLNDAPIENEVVDVAEQVPVERRVLTADDILNADDIQTEEVPVEEWGGPGAVVLIQTMAGSARDRFEAALTDKNGKADTSNVRAQVVAASAVDENGNLLFTGGKVIALGKKSSKPLDRCFEVARRLSGMSEEDIEELEKN